MYHYFIKYYGAGCFIRQKWIDANSKADAVKKLRSMETVIEIICCLEAMK